MPGSLRGSSLRSSFEDDDFDPASGTANLADAMLVFACGLMMSLVIFWNVDIGPTATEVTQSEQFSEVDGLQDLANDADGGGNSYEEMGTVYRDPTTGKLYMLSDEAEDQGDGASSGNSETGTADSEGE